MAERRVEIEIAGRIEKWTAALAEAETRARASMQRINTATTNRTSDVDFWTGGSQSAERQAQAELQALRNADRERLASYRERLRDEVRLYAQSLEDRRRLDQRGTSGRSFGLDDVAASAIKIGLAFKVTEAGIKTVTGVVAAFRGNAVAAQEAFESIPLAGGLFRAVRGLGEAISDDTKRMEEWKRSAEDGARAAKKWVDEYERVQRLQQARADRMQALDREQRLIGMTPRQRELAQAGFEQEDAIRGLSPLSQEFADATRVYRDKKAEIEGRYAKEEARRVKDLAAERDALDAEFLGDKSLARAIRGRARAESQIDQLPADADKRVAGLIRTNAERQIALQEIEDQRKQREDQIDKEKQKRSREFDMREQAQNQAKSAINERASVLNSQRLAATDAGFLTRGVGADKATDLATEGNRLTEETNRILNELVRRQRDKEQFVNVGFN